MLIEVKNKQARASFLPASGGLLVDLRLQSEEKEVFCLLRNCQEQQSQIQDNDKQNNMNVWPTYGSPLLFPFAGRVWFKGEVGKYNWLGEVWEMPIHGLGYQRPWKIKQQEESAITLYLEDDLETRRLFPYHFLLETRYELGESALNIKVKVENRGILKEFLTSAANKNKNLGEMSMPLNLGLHPFFQICEEITNHNQIFPPLQNKGSEDLKLKKSLSLELSVPSRSEKQLNWHKVAGGQSGSQVTNAELSAKLSASFPRDEDAIITCAGSEFGLDFLRQGNRRDEYKLSISADARFTTWVLHSRQEEDFVCVEPWFGPPNNIETKYGLQLLPAGASLESNFCIRLHKKHQSPKGV